MSASILVIDDEESMCNFMEIMLAKEGYQVQTVSSARDGISLASQKDFDLIISDLNMPDMSGIEVLKEIRAVKENQDMVMMTAFASVDTAIEAMKQGASDYITKPFKIDEIKLVIEKSIRHGQLKAENDQLKKQLASGHSFDSFLGVSEAVMELKSLSEQIAMTDSTILIRGESGTGKDVLAKAIHHHSDRSGGPFITINCAALPENLLESELFGHRKGAFTGATKDKDGLFKVADSGTFFLDEVGNTSVALQVKLLRVLEDKKITPVGDTVPQSVDVRLIAATNADLESDVKAGRFREDLFYRLNVIPITIPPLRERTEDIALLAVHFVKTFCNKLKVSPKQLSEEALARLCSYRWPGNVRELENTIERAVLLSKSDRLEIADFPEKLIEVPTQTVVQPGEPLNPTLESIEKAYIHFVMSQTEGKKSSAAKILGINASTLYRKLERYNLKDFLLSKSDRDKNE